MLESWQLLLGLALAVIVIVVLVVRMRRSAPKPEPVDDTARLTALLTEQAIELRNIARNDPSEEQRAIAVENLKAMAPLLNMTPEQIVDEIENERR